MTPPNALTARDVIFHRPKTSTAKTTQRKTKPPNEFEPNRAMKKYALIIIIIDRNDDRNGDGRSRKTVKKTMGKPFDNITLAFSMEIIDLIFIPMCLMFIHNCWILICHYKFPMTWSTHDHAESQPTKIQIN